MKEKGTDHIMSFSSGCTKDQSKPQVYSNEMLKNTCYWIYRFKFVTDSGYVCKCMTLQSIRGRGHRLTRMGIQQRNVAASKRMDAKREAAVMFLLILLFVCLCFSVVPLAKYLVNHCVTAEPAAAQ